MKKASSAQTKKASPSLPKKAMRKINQFQKSVEAKVDSVASGLKRMISPEGAPNRRQPAVARVSRKLAPKR